MDVTSRSVHGGLRVMVRVEAIINWMTGQLFVLLDEFGNLFTVSSYKNSDADVLHLLT